MPEGQSLSPILRRYTRYTDSPALVYLLKEQKVTLLDPQSWDDSNDSYYLRLYRERKRLQSVLALCFTQASETYHHWPNLRERIERGVHLLPA